MRYDLDLLKDYCGEIGLPAELASPCLLNIQLGHGAVLQFESSEREVDCLMGFSDSGWHTHDNLMFADPRGHHVSLDPLDVLDGLVAGTILTYERYVGDKRVYRMLIHSDYNSQFQQLDIEESIVVRRAVVSAVGGNGKHRP